MPVLKPEWESGLRNPEHRSPIRGRVLVSQLGARDHYLAARCFAKAGMLSALVTDFWSPFGQSRWLKFRGLPGTISSALARFHPDLAKERVVCLPQVALAFFWRRAWGCSARAVELAVEDFAKRVGELEIQHDVFFGFSSESLPMLRRQRARGGLSIVVQTDAGATHYHVISEEERRWPEFVTSRQGFPRERCELLRQEWALADVIIANSEWTRDAIVAQGGDPGKIEVVPLANEVVGSGTRCSGRRQKLTLLWMAHGVLSKGMAYLIEAANLLAAAPVEFLICGQMDIPPTIIARAPKNMRWLGRIPRSRTAEVYGRSDVLVFPTLSDGFGMVQLEAMGHGLPVIATPNCGRVVEDGVNGFLVPARDSKALAQAIMRFVREPGLLAAMAPRCLHTAQSFSVDRYGQRLLEIVQKRMVRSPA